MTNNLGLSELLPVIYCTKLAVSRHYSMSDRATGIIHGGVRSGCAKARLFSPLLPRLSDTASLDIDFKIKYVALFQERHGKNKSKAVAFLHFLLKPCPVVTCSVNQPQNNSDGELTMQRRTIMKDSELLELYKAGVRDFCNVNLRNANLCKANLPGISLANAVLIAADLSGADLSFANLSGADLTKADLFKADLSNADLSNADLSDADLSKADLSKACLFKAKLHKTELVGADLFEADLRGANLSEAGLSRASLNRANLNAVEESNCGVDYYSHSNLSGADLHNASLKEAQLSRADLSQVYLCKANLTRANLCRASLHSANLANAEVSGADLRHADLRDANLVGADLTNVNLQGAKLDGTILHKLKASCPPNIDWTMPLLAQQADLIERLQSDCFLHCEIEGKHSELTVIYGDTLNEVINFCWTMAEKYKRNSPVRRVFINNMKGKLGEKVVKIRLGDFVTEVDYEKRIYGDEKVDFRVTSAPAIGIQVKTRYGSPEKIEWSISSEEAEKNNVLVCILGQEKFEDRQERYKLILAGFLPTSLIKKGKVRIDQLLYGGGLRSYLESLNHH